MIKGKALTTLGAWIAARHDTYKILMKRIQQMIAAITIAEKNERSKDKEVQKAILGYDPEVWMEIEVQIRDSEQAGQAYCKLDLHPVVKSKRKFGHCSQLYIDIHSFLADREWAPAQQENSTGGTTWIELFILFDTSAARSAT